MVLRVRPKTYAARRAFLALAVALAAFLVGPTVRAASAAPAANPPVSSGLQLWYEANTESQTNGATVTRWRDKSGFSRDLTAASSANGAKFRTNAVNGRAAMEFDGLTSLLKTYETSFTLSQPNTFFVV